MPQPVMIRIKHYWQASAGGQALLPSSTCTLVKETGCQMKGHTACSTPVALLGPIRW